MYKKNSNASIVFAETLQGTVDKDKKNRNNHVVFHIFNSIWNHETELSPYRLCVLRHLLYD